ncbi:MAG: hypothetical protein K940chlam2_01445 [Chlamydiae bacterium]|nr:hypothetical protein [Chlamydiota bacterium]
MTDGTAPIDPTEASKVQRHEQQEAKKISVRQEASQINMKQFGDEAAFNPIMMSRRFQTLEQKRKEIRKEEAQEAEKTTPSVDKVEEVAEAFHKRNSEFDKRSLLMLRSRVSENDSAEELLHKVMESYPDHSLADEALDYLSETSDGKLKELVGQAKSNLNETYGREVRAGRNIGAESRAFSQEGLGSPTGLRDLYREITGNPRDAPTLFEELSEQFTFEKMTIAIKFILHSIGADLGTKGPSISRPELQRLMTEARNLQAILWVYRFFQGRMDLLGSAFERNGMFMPSQITFEYLARLFVQFLRERYPSMDKVFQLGLKLGLSYDELSQIVVFGQMRDAVRGVAPRLFRSNQHRHDVLMSFIEALEELEDRLEEEEEEGEEE